MTTPPPADVSQSAGGPPPAQGGAPSVSTPKSGGAISDLGEKFEVNAVNGTGSFSIPIKVPAARNGRSPRISLNYNTGSGNSICGVGWGVDFPEVTCKTDKGMPRFSPEFDTFILSGAEDLVRLMVEDGDGWRLDVSEREVEGRRYRIQRYRPRVDGVFARIEQWTDAQTGNSHWRTITPDNVTTLYGRTPESRIADPEDPSRCFSWLVCESYDDAGNAILYEYKAEDSAGVDLNSAHEANRTEAQRAAQRHIKRIRFGNRRPALGAAPPDEWLFEVVFDYGDHDLDNPRPKEDRPWTCRRDPFSSYRSTFEVRTYRLCQRVLVFHHFPEEADVGVDCLVSALELAYRGDAACGQPRGSLLATVTHRGYRRRDGGYVSRALPPIKLEYTPSRLHGLIKDVDTESVRNLPVGASRDYRWLDLDGEGLPGILTEESRTWYYLRNLGNARFGPSAPLAKAPSVAALASGRQQFMDVDSDGRIELVSFDPSYPGFYERSDNGWASFRAFREMPKIDWSDPNLRWIDLDGDGLSDVLLAEDDCFTWFRSLGETGFAASRRIFTTGAEDERQGPRLVYSDLDHTIFLADMSGDGLSDLVRIRNGEVCYWPNLGFGHFGARVTMDRSPWFDEPALFDHRRLRLADIDGTGTSDLIYLGASGVRAWFNELGNGWSESEALPQAPALDTFADVSTIDLFGAGTTCLVWSTAGPAQARCPMQFIDLMGGIKPHLLTRVDNSMGAVRRIHYEPSTRFYLADRAAGTPWVTRLPFPIQVVARVDLHDSVSGNRFRAVYRYHHGFFDGYEREFRGFGMVEEVDTEQYDSFSEDDLATSTNLSVAIHVPPVRTRTWFNVGQFDPERQFGRSYEHEYYREPGITPEQARGLALPPSRLPEDIPPEELREAYRALKNSVLRREIYADDGSDKADRPYSVIEMTYDVRRLQPRGPNRYASFFVHTLETVDFNYERMLYPDGDRLRADPRVTHAMTLEVDAFGNLIRSVSIAYGRRHADPGLPARDQDAQAASKISFEHNGFTNLVDTADAYRLPIAAESRTFELYNIWPPMGSGVGTTGLLRRPAVERRLGMACDGRHDLPYADFEGSGALGGEPFRRLIEHQRELYRRDDLTGPLPWGRLEALGLPFDSYVLAFTPDLISEVFGDRVSPDMLESAAYVRLADHPGWWKPSGRIFYSPDPADPPDRELSFARVHFFAPHRFEDPFGNATFVAYDPYSLLVQQTTDALGNRNTAGERDPSGRLTRQGNDYRVLEPRLVMDANRNRTEAAFDALGVVVGTALRGKPEENLGDTLDGFEADLPEETVLAHLKNPLDDPAVVLGGATTRMLYDLFAVARALPWERAAPVRYSLSRTVHVSEIPREGPTRYQHIFTYIDSFNREIQKSSQAEPGPIADGLPDVDHRWVISGQTIFNNKGDPVRQYEPSFTPSPAFSFGVTTGVSSILFYDPARRVVARLHPNHTYEKAVLEPWRQTSWDVNDTVIDDPSQDFDAGGFFRRLPQDDYLPTWYAQRIDGGLGAEELDAAEKAAVHAGTPARIYFDAMGRVVVTVAHNRFERDGRRIDEHYVTRLGVDLEGNRRRLTDAQGRIALVADFDMTATHLRHVNLDSGVRCELADVTRRVVVSWDGRGHRIRNDYDHLRRLSRIHLSRRGQDEIVVGRTVYGEEAPDAEARNLRTRAYQTFDNAGLAAAEAYDFKGNVVRSRRQLLRDFRADPDWGGEAPLENEVFEQGALYDALNRPVQLIPPHSRECFDVIQPAYNQASLLKRINVWRGARDAPAGSLLDETTADLRAVERIDYDAKGQRTRLVCGNGTLTRYDYDPLTFRLKRITTARSRGGERRVQDLRYSYDPAGNICSIKDDARPDHWFRGRHTTSGGAYVYDATYRLVAAVGREHVGQQSLAGLPGPYDDPPLQALQPGNAQDAFAPYRQSYAYDEVGNILELVHRRLDAAGGGFRRLYDYLEPSAVHPTQHGNRLSATQVGGDRERYGYDEAGNTTAQPHLIGVEFDYRDQMRRSVRDARGEGEPEGTWYVYDGHGRRVRKVITRASVDGPGARRRERIYLDGFEVYREYETDGETTRLERETLHVADDARDVALIDTRTCGEDPAPKEIVRFQYGDHQSSVLELDREARLLTYEEYYPWGSSSYRLTAHQAETPKRYRFNAKEKDEENGLYYYGARYYAAWLGRWTSCDPKFRDDWPNVYAYARDNPVVFSDPDGREEASNWNRFMGGLKLLGGLGQTIGGAVVFVQVEVPVAAQVVGGIAVVHGVDDMSTGLKQLISGKNEKTLTQQAVAGTAKLAGVEEQKAEAIGTGVDVVAGFISPAPITGVGKGAAVTITVNAPRLQVLAEANSGMKILNVESRAVQVTVSANQVAAASGALQATGTLLSTGGPGGGGGGDDKGSGQKKKQEEPKKAGDEPKPREVKTVQTHPSTGGNRQVEVNGQRWNLPKGTDPAKIPAVDKVGDQLQAATKAAASQWNVSKLTMAEREAIRAAQAEGKPWLANILRAQAKGRWIEKQVRTQFPNLQWQRQGVDAIDPATGLKYDILSGTVSNMALHAKRMAGELFRMITF